MSASVGVSVSDHSPPPAAGGAVVGWRGWLLALGAALAWVALIRPGPLSLPYFWDEADVYVPGAVWVAGHGLDVTPGVFPDDYSRGHPPLLFLIAGAAFRLFGAAPAVGHLVVLPFTVLALAGTFALGATLFGRRAGVAAAALLGATPLFMSIGNMLLPELPLTALAVLALLALARGRPGLAALAGVAAALIKETGVFVAGALAAAVLWDAWRRGELRRPRRAAMGRLALALAPVAALCAFFAWQRATAGYFIFPHHQGLLWERTLGWRDLGTVWPSLLLWHGRWLVVAAAALWLAARGRVALAAARGANGSGAGERWRPGTGAMVVAIATLALENAIFFTKMFWLERYALPAHPGVLVLACGALLGGWTETTLAPRRWARALPWAVVAAAAGLGLAGLGAPTRPDEEEHTFVYAQVIATHRQAFARVLELGGDPLVVTAWPMTIELRNPDLGYVDRAVRAVHVDHAAGAADVAAVLVPERSQHRAALLEHARRLGLERSLRFQAGPTQALELYTR